MGNEPVERGAHLMDLPDELSYKCAFIHDFFAQPGAGQILISKDGAQGLALIMFSMKKDLEALSDGWPRRS